MKDNAAPVVKLLVTIVDRGKSQPAVELLQAEHLHFHYACLGYGTANSSILDYLGLGETDKDVVLSLAPQTQASRLLRLLNERLQLSHPGRGIVFTVPLSSVSGGAAQSLCAAENQDEGKDEAAMEGRNAPYDLIVAVVGRGSTDRVMDAAKEAGATGGTLLHARRIGYEALEQATGISVQPEKEIVAMLVRRETRPAIMKAVNQAAGMATEYHGVLFSLPVDEILGLSLLGPTE